MYSGKSVSLTSLSDGIIELKLDLEGSSANVLNTQMWDEIAVAVDALGATDAIKGLLISSAKPMFVLGADITEFGAVFREGALELVTWLNNVHGLMQRIEDLPFPTVAMVNGMALGGGLELALSADFRVLDDAGQIGLPEVTLGLLPGWGGSVRLPRLIGSETALQWIMSGKPARAKDALAAGAVDRVVATDEMRDVAISLIHAANAGELDVVALRQKKRATLKVDAALKESLGSKLDPNFPAAGEILDSVIAQSGQSFDESLQIEARTFAKLALGPAAQSLIGLFLNDQVLKKKTRAWVKQAQPVQQAAVLGAGIMGGGIAYQSASTGTAIVMKDIRDDALDLGMKTANGLLDKQVSRGRMTEQKQQAVLEAIAPTLSYDEFKSVDYVVEAVVENENVKKSVLAEVEQKVAATAVLASNTSTISIDALAEALERPEQFCGMHFFNPVHAMRLVEVIRGEKTNDATIAATVAYATAMKKTPIVVRDCPGFLVNRVLFPYFNGFNRLLQQGVDFQRIDRVMENFGWPMGPAYLADVVGLDTMVHADQVMQQGFPERMSHDGEVVIESLHEQGLLGQKNGSGFYQYGVDENGRRTKEPSEQALAIMAKQPQTGGDLTDHDIIERMMVPMCMEVVRCLEDGIVDTPAEADMGLILGLGFPRFRGGALRYIDTLGLESFALAVERHAAAGPLYTLTDAFKARVAEERAFYEQ